MDAVPDEDYDVVDIEDIDYFDDLEDFEQLRLLEKSISELQHYIESNKRELVSEFDSTDDYTVLYDIKEMSLSFLINMLRIQLCKDIDILINNMNITINKYFKNPDIVDESRFERFPKYFTKHKNRGYNKGKLKTKETMTKEIITKLSRSNFESFFRKNHSYYSRYDTFVRHAHEFFSFDKFNILFENNIILTFLLINNRFEITLKVTLPPEIIIMVILPMCTNLELCYVDE